MDDVNGTAGKVDDGDEILQVQGKLTGSASITLTGGGYVQFQPLGSISGQRDGQSPATDARSTRQPATLPGVLGRLIAARAAMASEHGETSRDRSGGNSGGSSGGSSGGGSGGTAATPNSTFTVGDDRKWETGRSLSIDGSGHISTTAITCP